MGDIYLRVEGFAGASITNTCEQMVALAMKLDLTIMCKFNGIDLMAKPHTLASELEKDFKKQLKQSRNHCRIATA